MINGWKATLNPWTVRTKATALRAIVRGMAKIAGGPDLTELTPRTPRGQQRTRTASHEELQKLYTHASPGLRYCLLCWAQLAMRFTEALVPTPAHYNKENQTIDTVVKGRHKRTFPAPPQLARQKWMR